MLVSASHSQNAFSPIFVTEFGMLMLFIDLYYGYATFLIFVSDSVIMMLFSDLHPSNAWFPIFVTDSGMLMLVIVSQQLNA